MTDSLCPSETLLQSPRPQVEIENQSKAIGSNRQLLDVLDSFPGFVLVLNQTRQIVFANQAFIRFLGASSLAEVLEKKPGDALACEHAMQSILGCGTTCSAAGATPAIILHQPENSATQECRIRQESSGKSFDFRVQTAPFPGDDSLYLFYLTDISHEKRRRALERIFFHDVANIAIGMVGLSRILCEKELIAEKEKRFKKVLHRYAHRLTDEVEAQRALAAAENNDLHLKVAPCKSLTLLDEIAAFYHSADNEQTSRVEIAPMPWPLNFLPTAAPAPHPDQPDQECHRGLPREGGGPPRLRTKRKRPGVLGPRPELHPGASPAADLPPLLLHQGLRPWLGHLRHQTAGRALPERKSQLHLLAGVE